MASRYCYPPMMPSSLPAIVDGTILRIKFNLSNLNFQDEIKHIQFIISYQINNKSAVNSDQWLNDIIYIPWNAVKKDTTGYYCDILGDNLEKGKWVAGNYYKIQARFGLDEFPGQSGEGFDYTQLADWERKCQEQNLFTEWSTVTVIKVIPRPEIGIIGLSDQSQVEVGQQYISSNLGVFVGYYYNSDQREMEDTYQFKIFQGETLIHDSGILQHNARDDYYISEYLDKQSNINSVDIYKSKFLLETENEYRIEYTITTRNLYTETKTYNIGIVSDYTSPPSISLRVEVDGEEAGIKVFLTSLNGNTITGNYVLVRSSAETNYRIWEDLAFLNFSNNALNDTFAFEDLLIESGLGYRYGIQKINKDQTRSELVYEADEDPIICYYEFTYLYENGHQLKIPFDNEVGNFKQTHLESKQDAMGSKYPFITRNGITSYHDFSLGGLITYHMDDMEKFIFNNTNHDFTTDLTFENTYFERKFRQEVINWLNNGNYKLFKSPTEGLMIIALVGASFSPNTTVNRMIYSFSTSAYEIADCTIANLNDLGIYNIGEVSDFQAILTNKSGQVRASATESSPFDIVAAIKEQQEIMIDEEYQNVVSKITSISIESTSLTGEDEIALSVNGNRIEVGFNGLYVLDNVTEINTLYLLEGNNVIINYVCAVETVEAQMMTLSLTSSFIKKYYGQLKGYFGSVASAATNYSLDIKEEIWKNEFQKLQELNPDNTYTLRTIDHIIIEAEPGTVILFDNGRVMVVIGNTGVYNLDLDYNGTIKFENSAYAIITYQISVLEEERR